MSDSANTAMALGMSERVKPIHEKVANMIREDIAPLDEEYLKEVDKGSRWEYHRAPD